MMGSLPGVILSTSLVLAVLVSAIVGNLLVDVPRPRPVLVARRWIRLGLVRRDRGSAARRCRCRARTIP